MPVFVWGKSLSYWFNECLWGLFWHNYTLFLFLPPPQLLFKCSVMWFLNFLFSVFVFCIKNHSPRATAWQVQDTIGRKQGGRPETKEQIYFLKALHNRCSVKRTQYRFEVYQNNNNKNKLYSPCTPQLLQDHLAPSSLDAPFGFIGSNSENICCVQSEC